MVHEMLWQVALPRPFFRYFDYRINTSVSLEPGLRVLVPFGKSMVVGILVAPSTYSELPEEKIRTIEAVLDTKPLWDIATWKMILFASYYYAAPLGEVWLTGLPRALRQGKPCLDSSEDFSLSLPNTLPIRLTTQQNVVLSELANRNTDDFSVSVLHGVTGSGKTALYLSWVLKILRSSLTYQALILLPEINLLPQLVDTCNQMGLSVRTYHSQCSESYRLETYQAIRSGQSTILIGTRSALFLPFKNLRCVIVDEEHEAQYKQHEGFHFQARDLAIKRGQLAACPVLLVSATPSLETWHHIQTTHYHYHVLPERIHQQALPQYILVDMNRTPHEGGLSHTVACAIQQTLERGEQCLIFLNRKGFAPVWFCQHCREIIRCQACDCAMVYYQQNALLKCHVCQRQAPATKECSHCHQSDQMRPVGLGTERLEALLQTRFPQYPCLRWDGNILKKPQDMKKHLKQIHSQEPLIILGTQMLAKGHDFPNVTLVAILEVDGGLWSIDFRSQERLVQLIYQVSGRAGRSHKPSVVFLQTHQPHHPLIQRVQEAPYEVLANQLLLERQKSGLPPFHTLILIRCHARQSESAWPWLSTACKALRGRLPAEIEILGPTAAPRERKNFHFHQQILLRSKQRALLLQALWSIILPYFESAPSAMRWSFDVDPNDLY